MEHAYGVDFSAPLTNLREYLTVITSLLHTGSVDFVGKQVTARARIRGIAAVPVMASALRPRSFEVCGELADGAISWMWPKAYLVSQALPAIAVGTYLRLGHPDQPDLPLAARATEQPGQSLEDLVARVEAHLAQEPNDLRGWEVIVPVYMRMGRIDDAVAALRNTIRIGGSNEQRQTALGEALVAAADGQIGETARAAFAEALRLEPRSEEHTSELQSH